MQITNAISPMLIARAAATQHSGSFIAHLNKYEGKPSNCQGFLLKNSLYFTSQGRLTDKQKIAQFMNMLLGKALQWAAAVWQSYDEALASFDQFLELFHHVYEHCLLGGGGLVKIGKQLQLGLRRSIVQQNIQKFCTLPAGSN